MSFTVPYYATAMHTSQLIGSGVCDYGCRWRTPIAEYLSVHTYPLVLTCPVLLQCLLVKNCLYVTELLHILSSNHREISSNNQLHQGP
jgi:hypothetical protein